MNSVIAIIQARMGSTRLPGKVLLEIAGKPMLQRVVERARRAQTLAQVVVATTVEPLDEPIADFCRAIKIPFYRGSLNDVLDRYYQAARVFQADVIVRLTADCPLLDPGVIDHTVQEFFRVGVDFAANRLPPPLGRTYPIGLDTEVCTFTALERAWREATLPYEREHVMPYLYSHPGRFRTLRVDHTPDYGSLRWTVDTAQDLELVRKIYAHFGGWENFTWLEVLDLIQADKELALMNRDVPAKDYRESQNG